MGSQSKICPHNDTICKKPKLQTCRVRLAWFSGNDISLVKHTRSLNVLEWRLILGKHSVDVAPLTNDLKSVAGSRCSCSLRDSLFKVVYISI